MQEHKRQGDERETWREDHGSQRVVLLLLLSGYLDHFETDGKLQFQESDFFDEFMKTREAGGPALADPICGRIIGEVEESSVLDLGLSLLSQVTSQSARQIFRFVVGEFSVDAFAQRSITVTPQALRSHVRNRLVKPDP